MKFRTTVNYHNMELPLISANKKSGEEKFISANREIDIKLLDFWQWSTSNLLSNVKKTK